MHELSVCMSLLEQVEAIAAERSAATVTKIELDIGPLSGVEPELLRNAYPIAVADTVAESAELVINDMPVIVRCTGCGADSEASPNKLVCSDCGDFKTRIVSGDEMILRSVELEA